jgi:hypothetical protein
MCLILPDRPNVSLRSVPSRDGEGAVSLSCGRTACWRARLGTWDLGNQQKCRAPDHGFALTLRLRTWDNREEELYACP